MKTFQLVLVTISFHNLWFNPEEMLLATTCEIYSSTSWKNL